MRKSRGTFAAPLTIVTGDILGRLVFGGYEGTNYNESAYIRGTSTGTIATNRVPSKLEFFTSTDAAPSVATVALTLNADQSATFANRVNNITFTVPASAATFTLASGKTVTLNNTLAFSGTDGTAHTFPSTSSTLARTDAPQVFTGNQTFSNIISPLGTGLRLGGQSVTSDAAPGAHTFQSQSAYSQAATNTAGADLNLAVGLGRRLYTSVSNTAGVVTVTITVNGSAVALVSGTNFALGSDNTAGQLAVTATNLAAAINANGTLSPAVTATASNAIVYLDKALTTRTLTIATSQASRISATSGTDGQIIPSGKVGSTFQFSNNFGIIGTKSTGTAFNIATLDNTDVLNIGAQNLETDIQSNLTTIQSQGVVVVKVTQPDTLNSRTSVAIGSSNTSNSLADTLDVSDRIATNSTTVRLRAGPAQISSSEIFRTTLTDGTTKKFALTRDGMIDNYLGTATAGMGVSPVLAAVSSTAQSASVTTTNLQCGGAVCPAGVYRVTVYHVVTTAGSAGTLSTTVGWNDGTAARTKKPAADVDMSSTNYDTGQATIVADGVNNITYSTTVAGATGSPVYAVYVTLLRDQ
jgi:hypothetical protein